MAIVGVDVGGTFTDVIAFDPNTGKLDAGKVPSTSGNLTEGFAAGLARLGIDPKSIIRLLHGTTVATNAAIERKGARTAGVFTRGFRDVLAIGSGQRFVGGLFNPAFRRSPPLIPRSLSFEVGQRNDYLGRELVPLSKNDLEHIALELTREKVGAIAICFLHAYADGSHEIAAEEFLRERLPGVFVCRSADVSSQSREYERFSTAAFNAYLGPVVEQYLSRLEERLQQLGCASDLLLMTSNGGVVSGKHAARYPVFTVLSGPAGGISAGLYLGAALGVSDLITCDMGGTSTDVCLIKNLRPALATQRIVGGLPLRIPQLDINTIGAGGGSIGRIEADGTFRVGPESAGAFPGPACYDRKGTDPTVTDANLILGRLGASSRLGGVLPLRVDLAQKAMEKIKLGLKISDLAQAAEGVLRVAVSNMAGAIREISIERGEDPRAFALVPCGGAGPMHGCEVAEQVGVSRVIVPLYPGNFSALGLLVSDLRHEFVRSYRTLIEEADMAAIAAALRQMGNAGRDLLVTEGAAPAEIEIKSTLDLRFKGQSAALGLDVNPASLSAASITADFRSLYLRTWSHEPEAASVQIVDLRVTAIGKAIPIALHAPNSAGSKDAADARKETRPVYFNGRFHDTAVYDRARLSSGTKFLGPAIIDENGATTVVPPGWHATVHPTGHLFLERK